MVVGVVSQICTRGMSWRGECQRAAQRVCGAGKKHIHCPRHYRRPVRVLPKKSACHMAAFVADASGEMCDTDLTMVGPFRGRDLTQRQVSILHRIEAFYTPVLVKDILVPLVNQESGISLRALDWLVTNYSKKHNVVCRTKTNMLFNIYHGYKIALTHFRRRNFDPFRRRKRIEILVNGDIACESTIGQCNFLHWSYNNGVLAYAVEHSKDIEADMNNASAQHKAERRMLRASGLPHRRKELSVAPRSKCSVYHVQTKVRFHCMAASDSETDT